MSTLGSSAASTAQQLECTARGESLGHARHVGSGAGRLCVQLQGLGIARSARWCQLELLTWCLDLSVFFACAATSALQLCPLWLLLVCPLW